MGAQARKRAGPFPQWILFLGFLLVINNSRSPYSIMGCGYQFVPTMNLASANKDMHRTGINVALRSDNLDGQPMMVAVGWKKTPRWIT